jgi:hypothetical protein
MKVLENKKLNSTIYFYFVILKISCYDFSQNIKN